MVGEILKNHHFWYSVQVGILKKMSKIDRNIIITYTDVEYNNICILWSKTYNWNESLFTFWENGGNIYIL